MRCGAMVWLFHMGGIAAALIALAAGLAAGCGAAGSSNRAPPATATVDAETSGLKEHHRFHHGGVAPFVALSLDTLGASPEQQAAIDELRAQLRAEVQPARVAEQAFLATLADGLETGFDPAKVNAALDQLTQSAAAMPDATAPTLNALHDLLTPAQRAALIDKINAHWAVWRSEHAKHPRSGGVADEDRVAKLAEELSLTPNQKDRIRAALAQSAESAPPTHEQEIAAHLQAFDEAFRGDTFDARALTTSAATNAHLAGWGATHLARVVVTMSPILMPSQRAALAQTLREHAAHAASTEGSS